MKRAIQEKIEADYAGMTADEARTAQRRIEEDPELGPFLRQVRLVQDRAVPDRD
jgi:hypothetical protein